MNPLRTAAGVLTLASIVIRPAVAQLAAQPVARAGPTASAVSRQVDFDTEVVPILSKAGCNAAACHGGASGRGGFRLSLFGGDPEFDFDTIARQREGRRINWVDPARSLLLAKPLQHLEHGGGQRLYEADAVTQTLLLWIKQGAQRKRLRKLEALVLRPERIVADHLPHKTEILVTAVFDDGTKRNVNDLAIFESTGRDSMTVDEAGNVEVLRPGQHTLLIRFGTAIQPAQIVAPIGPHDTPFVSNAGGGGSNWVDALVDAKLQQLRLPASPRCDDAAFLRRVSLDLTGRLPEADQVQQFLRASHPGGSNSEDRERQVDALLNSTAFTDFWTYQLATLLRVRTPGNDQQAVQAYHDWLHAQVASDANWKRIVTEMLAARGDSHKVAAANFHRMAANAPSQAEYVAEVLMGVRIRCANCHRHPLDQWTQDDYHGFAQVFSKLDRRQVVTEQEHGDVIHPRTGKPAVEKIPGDRYLDASQDSIGEFANWLTSPGNRYFARSIVGHVWQRLMGRGLVDPPDDLRPTNPATHPELLARLAADFESHNYDLRHLIRSIVTTSAYARSNVPNGINAGDDRFYSRRLPRPLSAEMLADAIADVTEVANDLGDNHRRKRAVLLPDPAVAAQTLDVLGRCDRNQACDAPGGVGAVAAQLALLNGPLLNGKLTDPAGSVQRAIRDGRSTAEIVNHFYLRALGRYPTVAELSHWEKEIDRDASLEQRAERIVDFVWSLLTCHAFTHNH